MVKPSKSSSSCSNNSIKKNKFSVYEFDDDDHRVEKDSQKILAKFKRNPNTTTKFSTSPVDKYCFLSVFAQGAKTLRSESETEILDIDNGHDERDERICKLDAAVSALSDYEKSCTGKGRKSGCRVTDNKLLQSSPPQVLDENQPLCVDSDDEEGKIKKVLQNEPIFVDSDDDLRNEFKSSLSDSNRAGHEGSLEKKPFDHGSNALDGEATVVVIPDYIMFGNMYSTACVLTFSPGSIKLEGSTLSGTKRFFCFSWPISDIVQIKSFWCREVKTAMVNLHLIFEDEKVAEGNSKFTGLVELIFDVHNPRWFKIQEAIESLNTRYKATWKTLVDIDPKWSEFSCLEPKSTSFPKDCSPNEVFEDVIYPRGDPDAVSISKKDIELLQPATFINDTIIDFYVKYLDQKIKPEEKHRFHFFNSFYFRKLADLDKDRSSGCEGRAAFQRVRKWTRKVNLFEKDYLLIPVNFSLHWSLIVVCHPGEVASYRNEVVEKLSKVPCILHMDSIRGSHRGLKNLFQSYLWEEWRERHNEPSEDVSTNFLKLPFISLKLPQQENSFDCGLFLLYYVERFLQQAPVNFNPFTEASNFLNKEWFEPAEASSRRDYIKKLIYKVFKDNAHKDPPAANEPKYFSHNLEGDTGNGFCQGTCDGREASRGGYSSPNADEEIHKTSQAATPIRSLRFLGGPNFVSGDILSEGTAWSVAERTYRHHGKIESHIRSCDIMSPIEEEEVTGEQTVFSSNDKAGGRPAVASVSRVSMHIDHEGVEHFAGRSPISLEVQDEEECVSEVFLLSVSEERNKTNEASSVSSEELDCCVVEDTPEGNVMLVINENGNSLSCEARSIALYDLEVESPSNTDVKANHNKPVAASEKDQDMKSLHLRDRRFRRNSV